MISNRVTFDLREDGGGNEGGNEQRRSVVEGFCLFLVQE